MTTTPETIGALLRLPREEADEREFRSVATVPRLIDEAVEIRSRFAAHRRWEAALAALYETAGDLASLRDLEDVLQAIVSRARTLVGTDVAYLLLSDPEEGDTYVRVTDGITKDGFKTGRLAVGTGPGGLVAATAVPYHTADYPNDARFEHTPYVDGVIGAEGLSRSVRSPLHPARRPSSRHTATPPAAWTYWSRWTAPARVPAVTTSASMASCWARRPATNRTASSAARSVRWWSTTRPAAAIWCAPHSPTSPATAT
ncbi:hypothetical protein ACIOZL_42250 [Streptomyces sp. NPDC087769]|uniref:GAF domain-containing protein n=1 Tax=Streptomyces sp. NPDC087769 TaxID=3365802 RepID=UPI0038125152